MPVRIHRKRVRGWIMPPNTVSVTRPGIWGNPFKFSEGSDIIYGNASHRRKSLDPFIFIETCHPSVIRERCIELYKEWLNGSNPLDINPPPDKELLIKRLKGRNLACFCKLDKSCHADILLEIANS